MISGGYYIKARKTQNSKIATAPPHIREVWDWLIKSAVFNDRRMSGISLKRGQLLTSYSEIQDGLCWYIGYRKMVYTKAQTQTAMKWLKKHDMITTTRTTRGMLITVCNYCYYQNAKNYESHSEDSNENHNENHNGAQTNYRTRDDSNNKDERINECNELNNNYTAGADNDKHKKQQRQKQISTKYTSEFESFWGSSTRRGNKKTAFKSFQKIIKTEPDLLPVISDAMAFWKNTDDWTKSNGQFAPHVSTWLNANGWEDERSTATERQPETITLEDGREIPANWREIEEEEIDRARRRYEYGWKELSEEFKAYTTDFTNAPPHVKAQFNAWPQKDKDNHAEYWRRLAEIDAKIDDDRRIEAENKKLDDSMTPEELAFDPFAEGDDEAC